MELKIYVIIISVKLFFIITRLIPTVIMSTMMAAITTPAWFMHKCRQQKHALGVERTNTGPLIQYSVLIVEKVQTLPV